MSNNSLNIIETSRRYAKAVILASANDKKKINKIKDDFESLIKLLKQMKELESFIETPLLNSKKKK